ncbi:MAG: CotH kinase family protein [Bacteroidales bacterium]|nr:CotH kinase family protein [Candidatus Liminaster caballi]
MKRLSLTLVGGLLVTGLLSAQNAVKLTGDVIGSKFSIDYSDNRMSTTVNTVADAFDGRLDTYFASYERSNTWCGLDLGKQCVITKVGWSPRNDSNGSKRVCLAVFEGANLPDFSDALPLYVTQANGTIGKYSYADVDVSKSFRYVRYVGPNDARCNVAEVEFYGYEGEGSDSLYYQITNLPLVVINTNDAKDPIDKVNDKPAYVKIISKDGMKLLADTATVRLRGNASKDFPKKPYRIKFDQKHHVLGSPAKAKKWTLINNYGDKTLMRNMIAFEISRRMKMEYTPFCTPVDVIMNGEYKGCYQLCDQVEVHKDRVEVEKQDSARMDNPAACGYFIEVDAYATTEDCYFYSNKNNPVTIKFPDSDEITSTQIAYVKGRFNTMESRLFSSSYTNPTSGYRSILNLDSFLRHFIVGELSGNTDTYWSTNMYRHSDEDMFYVGPVWDFDLAFENDGRTYPINNKNDYIYRSGGSYAGNMKSFVDRIIVSDQEAKKELKHVWSVARNSYGLTADTLVSYVEQTAELLDRSQKLNFMRWNILNSYVHQNPRIYGSYAGEVENVKNYIRNRFTWMDRKVGYDPEDVDTSIEDEDPTGIDSYCNASDLLSPAAFYNLNGQRIPAKGLDNLPSGIYVMKQGQTTRKIVVR